MTEPTTDIVLVDTATAEFELDQRRAKAYSESGYWPDAGSVARALVKIEAGRSLGLPPLLAMTEIHVIEGKPTLGAGGHSALVKAHPRYDYRVVLLTNDTCELAFYEGGVLVGTSTFTREDAKEAELLKDKGSWKKYPRNMLFARAMSNGVAWYCPDVTMGRVYSPDEIDASAPPPPLPDDLPPDLVDDEIPFGDPVTDTTEEYELEHEYLNDQEAEAAVVDALEEMTDP